MWTPDRLGGDLGDCTAMVALHAELLVFGRNVEREAKLTLVFPRMRVMTHRTHDREMTGGRRILLDVSRIDTPGLERALAGVTIRTSRVLGWIGLQPRENMGFHLPVLGLGPFLDKGLMHTIVTLG